MKIKENIYQAISTMNSTELMFLYEQIRVLERLKKVSPKEKMSFSIDEIHKLTASSEGQWADDVIADREERL